MRNLRNVRFGRWRHQDITAVGWDAEKDEILCAVGPTDKSSSIELVRVSENEHISTRTVASWNCPSPSPDVSADAVLDLHFLSSTGSTCLVFEGGDIVTVTESPLGASSPDIEIVGTVDAGIAAARWSPDEELLAVATKAGTLVFMGSTFDPVAEVAMSADDLHASRHVSVGWGKKETQFQGRGAKAMRDPTIPEKVDEGLPSANEDGKTIISWRGDGAYVAVNAAVEGARRAIRVYSREGVLDSASEPVDGLESTMSWRPTGNLIAGIQRRTDRVDVVFFERNGLRHGEFTLRSPERSVASSSKHIHIRLEWNADSQVLAVMLEDVIQLWTTGNYHWYLKQELPIEPSCSYLSWHPEKPLRFAAASSSGVILAEQVFDTRRGSCRPPYDLGAVAVIDGETVKMTPLRTANVPPPMSLFDVTAGSSVVDVAFGPRNESFAVLHHKGVDVYEWPTKDGRPTMPRLSLQVPFETANVPEFQIALRICCSSEGQFRCMKYQDDLGHVQLGVRADAKDTKMNLLEDNKQALVATAMCEDGSTVEGYGQDPHGRLYKLCSPENELLPVHFPFQLPWFEVAVVDHLLTAFGLSRNGHLYSNSRLLAKNCTSFVVTPSHLIFTTNDHLVKFVHLAGNIEDLEVPGDDTDKDERCRSIERGARLVTAIPSTLCLVLQMPRGNLETIYPRAMVVAGIRDLIDKKDYVKAFSYCRTQRVDMNILYDHNPAQFLSNMGLFLDQLNDVTYIDHFLSSLKEEDVTKTMYRDTREVVSRPSKLGEEKEEEEKEGLLPTEWTKVNTICDAMLQGLQARKSTHLQNIITAHVCKQPPALDDGLTLVADLMRDDEKLAEKAIEHICFLVDAHRLYENALGLYDLELALLVAQQSQRDPREYVPFIQNLHKLPDLRRKFEIDHFLDRKPKALAHLKALDAFDELCTYTSKNALHQEALRLYRYDEPKLYILTDLYASRLESISSFREAGLAYESLQNYAKATSCYRAAGAACWEECLFVAQQQSPPPTPEVLSELASVLADALWEAKDYASAATIHAEYLSNTAEAIKCLCKGSHFAHAIRMAQRHSPPLLSTAVDAGLSEFLASTTEFLADCKAQLKSQVPRIAELRRKAVEDPLSFYEGERPGGADIPDNVSIAASSRISTSASLFTRYTGKTAGGASTGTLGTGVSRATSKNRRREEKKRARGRKGTVYEEEYLVNSVKRLVERVESTKGEVERLVFALVRRSMVERARAVETLMGEVSGACERVVKEIFLEKAPQGQQQSEERGGQEEAWTATGGDAVLQEFAAGGRGRTIEPPLVTGMKKMALLGS